MNPQIELLKVEIEKDRLRYKTCFKLIKQFPEDRQVIKEFLFKELGIKKEAPLKIGNKPVVRHFNKKVKTEAIMIDDDGEHPISTDEDADDVEPPKPKPKKKRKYTKPKKKE